mmetsp:Transcript_17366/g.33429  ORF Transcript_17366/g.33429 Transcript_17366/m.33429 type:complete len:91 (-) Transcript_17366:985-1257(-)
MEAGVASSLRKHHRKTVHIRWLPTPVRDPAVIGNSAPCELVAKVFGRIGPFAQQLVVAEREFAYGNLMQSPQQQMAADARAPWPCGKAAG